MSNRLFVGTRKGLFVLDRKPSGWDVSSVHFLGDHVSMFLMDPRSGRWYAAMNLGHFGAKLRRSDDEGKTWTDLAPPVFPEGAKIGPPPFPGPDGQPLPPQPATLRQIWSLETGGPEEDGLLWAGTIPGGLFWSTDGGDSWQLVESLWNEPKRMEWFGGGADLPGIHSICVDPRNSRHVLLGISCGGVWVTEDGGKTWALKGQGMRAEFMPPERKFDPNIQDAHRLVQCRNEPDAMWIQHHNGIFKSTDRSENYTEIKNAAVSAFGFAVAVHPHDGNTAWFIPGVKDECRVTVDGKLVVTRTRDGAESFEELRTGLPQKHCYDIVFRHGLDIDETGDRLAMGSSTGGLWTTDSGGDSWDCVSTTLPQIYCVRFA